MEAPWSPCDLQQNILSSTKPFRSPRRNAYGKVFEWIHEGLPKYVCLKGSGEVICQGTDREDYWKIRVEGYDPSGVPMKRHIYGMWITCGFGGRTGCV